MSDATTSLTELDTHPERMFPTLSPEQMARLIRRGRRRLTTQGEVLSEPGERILTAFLVVTGRLQIVLPNELAEMLIVTYGPGQFSGEVSAINGRPALTRLRVIESGEVIELDRERLLGVIQTDAELSEIIMRALILRRV